MKYWSLILFLFIAPVAAAQQNLNNQRVDGYQGIWFTLGQFDSTYGDKYSGGLGTYTAKHRPLAVYSKEADKTFFVYGGTTDPGEKHLLCMISYYDHKTGQVPKPVVVYDKMGVDDPHDNPSLMIDNEGYLWVFVSGRGRRRPGFKYKSTTPLSIESFEKITEEEMTYPQPHYHEGSGYFNFFTKYTGVRELYFETSPDGHSWKEDVKLAGIIEQGATKSGHYQVSGQWGNLLCTFFSRHPDGNVDKRTDLYYVQTKDHGMTWTTVQGEELSLPLTEVASKARIIDYASWGNNVYLKDLNFDKDGNPVCLYLTSKGHAPGPDHGPREWKITRFDGNTWKTSTLFQSDHNYDMGSLYIDGLHWQVIAPSIAGPQPYYAGGEMTVRESRDGGVTWNQERQLTKNSTMNHNYARRPLYAADPFYCFWADGDPATFSKSYLYFSDKSGNVYQLPYEMSTETAKPMLMR